VAKYSKNKIYRLKRFVTGSLETRRLTFFGWSDGDKEAFLSLWII
jgi:hypothetical protein